MAFVNEDAFKLAEYLIVNSDLFELALTDHPVLVEFLLNFEGQLLVVGLNILYDVAKGVL
jgi:hypothetical protein